MAATIPPVLDFAFKISGDEELKRRFADASSAVAPAVRRTLEKLAQQVVGRARSLVRRSRKQTDNEKRLADMIGYRFTLGRSGIDPKEGARVVIRADIGGRGKKLKSKAWAIEMGQKGNTRYVQPHNRRTFRGGGTREQFWGRSRSTSVKGSTINLWHTIGNRTSGGAHVSGYTRRFQNPAYPFLGPAGESMREEIEQVLTIALPRSLARLMAGEQAVENMSR